MKCIATIIVLLFTTSGVLAGCKTYWEGSAPFCNSDCPAGCTGDGQLSDYGDGGYCVSGHKQKCTCCGPQYPDTQPCISRGTKTECKGALLLCQNYEVTDPIGWINEKKCGSEYVCGGCLGWDSTTPPLHGVGTGATGGGAPTKPPKEGPDRGCAGGGADRRSIKRGMGQLEARMCKTD